MYDITSAKSLERLDTWHKELDKYDSEEGMVSHSQPMSQLFYWDLTWLDNSPLSR